MQDCPKLKIFHLRASNFYGGPERQLHLHAIRARDAGFDISVGSFFENGREPDFIKILARDGVPTHCFPVGSPYDLAAFHLLRKYLKENRIDILCTHDYRSQVLGFLATRGTRVKWLAFSRGTTRENLKVRMFQKLEKLVIRYASHIVAVSDSEKNGLLKNLIHEARISVVHNSIDADLMERIPKIDLRQRYRFPPDAIICISGGRFSTEKGQIHLVRAAYHAVRRNSKLRFVLFGDGPDRDDIISSITAMDLHDRIKCPGFEPDLIGCLKSADIFVNPSLSEGLPNIVLEAMALKIPVIATSVGGVPELITHGESGILVPPGDDRAMAQSILELLNFRPLGQKLAENAYRTILESYSFDKQMHDLAGIYRMLYGSKALERK
jgi:glycosyltransferase involved in cell wall biosynthesis